MQVSSNFSFRIAAIAAITPFILLTLALFSFASPAFASGKLTLLHTFTGGADGSYPDGNLTMDAAGNLYGTTQIGGTAGAGTVFKIAPGGAFSVMHEFSGGVDGGNPIGSVTFDAAGNAYLTTSSGGKNGLGVVLELTPPPSGASGTLSGTMWGAKVLYSFRGGSDGAVPLGGLVFDTAGNLYGTTRTGGHSHIGCLSGCGTIFELSPNGSGWHEVVLHRFLDAFTEGAGPQSNLVFDAAGNLYGTTYAGGNNDVGACNTVLTLGCGTVFELVRGSNGGWEKLESFDFDLSDGGLPRAGVTLDGKGNIYVATTIGGANGDGTMTALSNASGTWELGDQYSFDGINGKQPSGTLVLAADGSLYGTSYEGGENDWGGVFQLVPNGSGWAENLLYSFPVSGVPVGANPLGGVILDSAGNMYLTTNQGGSLNYCQPNSGCGTVIELSAGAQ